MCQRITGPLKGTISLIQMTSPLLAHLSPISIRSNLTHVESVPSFGSELSLFFLGGSSTTDRSALHGRLFFFLIFSLFFKQRLFSANTCHFTILPPNWQFPPLPLLQSANPGASQSFHGQLSSPCVYASVCVRARACAPAPCFGAPGQKRPVSQFVLDADSGPPGARRSPVYLPANERQ